VTAEAISKMGEASDVDLLREGWEPGVVKRGAAGLRGAAEVREIKLSLYDRYVLPHLTHLVMRSPQFAGYRERAADQARGDVLEIGIGSGLNLPHYGSNVRRVIGVEPSEALARLARMKAEGIRFPLEVHVQSAEDLPLPDQSVDTAVTTWSLCTIADAGRALREFGGFCGPRAALSSWSTGAPTSRVW
jgi:ubiquinone/menaquinone biosynthesis C-methylase UbiE